jgi:hypothetical protein
MRNPEPNLDSDQPVSHQSETLKKIISGGQTGADRMALDFAIWHEIPHGGWCPKGRKPSISRLSTTSRGFIFIKAGFLRTSRF